MFSNSEKLGINTTPATLFVGVGGIGSEIITRVAEMCAEGEAKNIRFVAMDTNANDLRGVKSSKANVVPIQTSSPQSVMDYLKSDEDARKRWFPNNTTLYSKTVSEGAGQVRAISRLALNATIKTGEIQKLYKAIDTLFHKDGEDLKQALRVVIVSSACGGTGSGIAMTVGMLIREYLHKNYREKALLIRGFLLLPGVMDTVIGTETERESLRRNGYATIKEINGFMIKASGFCGVRKDLERYDDLYIDVPTTTNGVERLENLPFDFCFLLDRVDHSQESMQTLEQYKQFAARSLYEQNIGPMQGDAFSMEDNVIKEFSNGNNLGRNRFGGIGASVIRYPYEDIADYIAYSRAIDRIGDGDTVGEWLKYDEAYVRARNEYKKKRSNTTEAAPQISDIYISSVDNGDKRFDNDIKRYLATDTERVREEAMRSIKVFLKQFEQDVLGEFLKLPEVKGTLITVGTLAMEKQYDKNPEEQGKAEDNLAAIRGYESMVKRSAASVSRARAKSILIDAPSIESDGVKGYHIEKLLKSADGAMHPNAMRYMLYLLKTNIEKKYNEAKRISEDAFTKLAIFSPQANDPDYFDVKARYSKEVECNIDQVCALEKLDLGFVSKNITGGFSALWAKLNELFPAYVAIVNKYRDAVVNEAAYEVALSYITDLNVQFEAFYGSFEAKVVSLKQKKEEIVDKLSFHKGDSVRHVCGSKDQLDMLLNMCPEGSDGLLLPDKLNSKIFDSIKYNAECERLAAYDTYGDYSKVDIFDDVLIGYFRESVRDDCDEVINLNIIRALATEQKLAAYLKANALKGPDEEKIFPKINADDRFEYLKKMLRMGRQLAAPGVGCADFREPREVPVCAYSISLNDMRDINVKQTLESMGFFARGADSVSKYDLRFFNALYNITPDNLSRFRAAEIAEEDQFTEKAGIYYKAYHDYVKKIGPDSTKCATISLHIDKRWDSLTNMPEISMEDHYDQMLKIHSSLVYGMIHGMIKTYQSSRYDVDKRIFALEDSEGDITTLVVSNGTECDEFYEVLDALYHDRATVSKIFDLAAERRVYDLQSNCRYTECAFFKDTALFTIGDGHKAPTSLFEIPLVYYNSLPRAMMDDNELSIMIDSVINVISEEVWRFEQESDRAPFLTCRLEEQFRLLVKNFKDDKLNAEHDLRKNTTVRDNRVINMVFRKVSNKIKELNTHDFAVKIDALRMLILD